MSRFRGMFAFAIWDAQRGSLFLARDRFGKKPLFISESGGRLIFASEIKAILAFPGFTSALNRDAIPDYLAYRYVPGPDTLFAGIRKLMPGCWLSWDRGRIEQQRYWWPPDRSARPENGAVDGEPASFLSHLDDAVRVRMVSDVPFGAFLSGGIDSSAVVGLMTRHLASPVKTFSVGFDESQYSELAYAAEIARAFATDHHELVVTRRDMVDQLPALIRYRDAPVAEPSDIPIYLLSVEAARSVKMVLTGEGSDEILAGYPKHAFERLVRGYQLAPSWIRRRLFEPVITALPYGFRRAKTAVATLGIEDPVERYPRWFGAFGHAELVSKLAATAGMHDEHEAPQFATQAGNSPLRSVLFFDQMSWLPDNLLERGDRMTMAASIEARMPFMDHELAEYVSSMPDDRRLRGFESKWILRKAMRALLPESILRRPKVGFRVPVNEWFRTTMREFVADHLGGADARIGAYFRPGVLGTYVDEHISGRQNHEKILWTLLTLEIWHREYGFTA